MSCSTNNVSLGAARRTRHPRATAALRPFRTERLFACNRPRLGPCVAFCGTRHLSNRALACTSRQPIGGGCCCIGVDAMTVVVECEFRTNGLSSARDPSWPLLRSLGSRIGRAAPRSHWHGCRRGLDAHAGECHAGEFGEALDVADGPVLQLDMSVRHFVHLDGWRRMG